MLRFLLLAGLAAAGAPAQTWQADNGNGTFSNPLFWDEFSDPDLIRVGRDFYLTGTTMHSMPGLPVLHSRDLVNWRFLTYASERLDLGPAFRLQEGKAVYGQGIWAPCFRYYNGAFYIFSNVNGQTTQLFRAKNPAGPWTRTSMKRALHDLSVLFDDDGKVHVVWGYRGIRTAQLNEDLTDLVPGTERELIAPGAGMGEGLHLYKVKGHYFLTSAWFLGEMRMPVARAPRMEGPWEVNQNISRGEDFGFAPGYRLAQGSRQPPYRLSPPDKKALGRLAIHQGGIVEAADGEWWGFSMMDANSVGRLTCLSPVTWTNGWPYFGLPGNLGRSPRIWVKPKTGVQEKPRAPYQRSDDFSAPQLQPVWQWNHVPVDSKWSLRDRAGFLRLHALPAESFWRARNTLTQRAVGPRSTATAVMDTAGMREGDTAGFGLFNRPYAWAGVERTASGFTITMFDEQTGQAERTPFGGSRIWLRVECDFLADRAQFSYSLDGRAFTNAGPALTLPYGLTTFQGVRWSLFNYNATAEGGYADFDSFAVTEPAPRGLTRPIPYGRTITLEGLSVAGESQFRVVDQRLGRVALRGKRSYVSVDDAGAVTMRKGAPGPAETFQWMETFTGETLLLSLRTHRYLRKADAGAKADAPGPRPDGGDGVRWAWR